MRKLLILLACVLAVSGCSRQDDAEKAMTDAAAKGAQPELLSRGVLFGNPERFRGRLSPDGRWVSYTAPVDGVMNVWVAPADAPAQARPLTRDTGRGVRVYFWAHDNRHILYQQDKNGDENWHIYSVNVEGGEPRDLTPYPGAQASLDGISYKHPQHVLIGINDRDASYHDLYRVDINSGERSLVQRNDGFAGFITDWDYKVLLGVKPRDDGGFNYLKPDGTGGWNLFFTVGQEDSLTTNPVGVTADGKSLYLADSRYRDTAGLFRMDVATGKSTLLHEDPRADVQQVLTHPVTGEVQAVSVTYTRETWHVLDDGIAEDIKALNALGGEYNVLARTHDDRYWIVTVTHSDAPLHYYRYDRDTRRAQILFNTQPALADVPLAEMHDVVIESRDGLSLVSYYTLPLGSDPDGGGRPDEALPLVLFVHGGPWGRDIWDYNAYHQWLANRGYAVLSVNFRASTGFGKAFVNAGDKEWAGKMHDDLVDAVQWAVNEGITTPERVAIMGGSYGGYATLAGLTFTPDTFACGVDIVGPSNLITLLESIPPYWKSFFEQFATRVGDPRTEEGRALLQARSPLTHADRINKPLLIGQGANDPRVKQAESDQIVQAMQSKGIPVTYVLFADEGHGFARPENNKAFNAVTEAFLGACLGGRVEPIGDDFAGSSVQVPHGAQFVPGLEAALPAAPAEE